MEQVIELLKRVPTRFYLPISLGIVGIIVFGYGLIYLLVPHGSRENFSVSDFSQASQSAKLASNTITIDVEGSVVRPGVYTVPTSARLQDSLVAAGGLSSGADRDWVAKHLNLAQKLSDGAKIYIPKIGEIQDSQPAEVAGTSGTSATNDVLGSTTSQININTASSDQLDSLPGIGPVTATKIINGRPYNDLNELVSRKIVTQKVFDKIKSQITLF